MGPLLQEKLLDIHVTTAHDVDLPPEFQQCTVILLTSSVDTLSPLQIESLGGFKIHHEMEDGEEVVFRFHHKSKLQGGASVSVSVLLC